jgi:small subunit ribosomal protein S14
MKRYLLVKDQNKRLLFARAEKKRIMLKFLVRDSGVSESVRNRAFVELSRFPRNSSKVRIKNRCMFTGRGPFTLRAFKLSRIVFREKASFGKIVGVKKAS